MIGLKRGIVELADHDPEWEAIAAQTIERLWRVFGSAAKDIQHVGSTAIKDIKAKPVIDIAVAVFNFDDVLVLSPVLAEQGFMCVGWENDGKVQPMYQCGEFVTGEKLPRVLTHYIHIVMAESQQWYDYINHRDYMNTCPAAAHEYELLKLQLADENSENYHDYFLGKQEYIQKAVITARLWNEFNRKYIQITPITKGWSEDKKYCVTTMEGTKNLLRITPISRYETRKALFEMLERVAALDIPMCRPVEFGACDDGVYALHSWIDGEDLETVLPKLTEKEQYVLGLKSGEIARIMHSIPAPETQEDWESRFNRKTDTKIQKYRECGLRFDGDEYVLVYIEQNRHLLKNRPQCFQHGDYHVGNMMVENCDLKIIDFDRYDFGDPWEEFNRIVWSAAASPHFATGQLRGYFGGEPPIEFFKLLAFYIASNTLSSIYWAVPFGQSDLDTMMKQARDVLMWFDNMNNPVPTWYLPEKQIYLQNPCRFLSTACWKKDYYTKPEDVQIFHEKDLDLSIYNQDEGTRYFRLIHYPQKHYENVLPDGYYYRVVNLPSETPLVADIINLCYPGYSLNTDEVYKWTQFPVFDNDLWVFICNKQTQSPVALGIADFDNDMGEGSLEWIQVLPEYRGYGLGKRIVLELLSRLKKKASFVTVSGEVDNPTNPESLYRKCGFVGEDVWYVFRNRKAAIG